MPAYCSCCGAEITLKAEACPACGMPRHGMLPPDPTPVTSSQDALPWEDSDQGPGSKIPKPKTA